MRAAILGACLGGDLFRLGDYVRCSSRLTHTDPRAERGALLVALAAHHGATYGSQGVCADRFLRNAQEAIPELDEELREILAKLNDHLKRGVPAVELADALGLRWGVSGYIYHTVPLALYCWLRHPGDFRRAVEEGITLGGDADSTGAVVGGIVGATVGTGGIPAEWLNGLLEWPRSATWMRALAGRLASEFPREGDPEAQGSLSLFWPGLLPRNLLFLAVVLAHGFRRLLPPY
jgi:ADP-ribosylglycohydrolase